jgi:type VI secretion system ImpB/VipA family protein
MSENSQHKLERVRAPRVQITYDVELGDAIESKELPFVVGIMADLSGHNTADKPPLKERKFIDLTPDNFDEMMRSISPKLKLHVENKLSESRDNPSELKVNLTFTEMDDFNPLHILKQIPALSSLYSARTQLKDLLAKLDGNESLGDILEDILRDVKKQNALHKELGDITAPQKKS